jgi:myo-inositol catabolism protein IolC
MEVREMQNLILDHEDRIKTLEKNYGTLVGEITSVKNGQLQLENTVLKTSQGQSELLNKLIDNTFDLKKTKLISRKEIWIAGLGGGSIIGLIIGAVIKFF